MANKRNLSLSVLLTACIFGANPTIAGPQTDSIVGTSSVLAHCTTGKAQVPPRSEAAQEQREEKTPLKDSTIVTDSDFAVFRVQNPSGHIQFQWEPLSIVFVTEEGKTSTILFTDAGVTYSGDVSFDESTKMFFDLFWKEYILEQHLKARCEGVVEEQEE